MQITKRHPPDIVKSVQQRWLISLWARHRHGDGPPAAASFDMLALDSCRDDLSILDVLPLNGHHRFRIFDHGRNVGAMYAGQCAGKFLDELLPEAVREQTLSTYEHAVRTGVPIYTVSHLKDAQGSPIDYERLLLPLAGADGSVVRILALLETISSEGTIARRELMSSAGPAHRFSLEAELHIP
jgi:hypothetical protein